ncbi:unnamed protein product [Rhizoctonia solani]|uniref:Uncharacterized protein n=1 Tax=Rhizoctonia solani TaxID=456999 RepID=A0A8H3E961_9AGAM|nr:unnamed protein product [Rhizoctonia solani]
MMQAPQSRPNDAPKLPLPPPNAKAYIRPIRILGNMNSGVSFAMGLWHDVRWLCSLEVVLHIYLVLFMLHNAAPELPPGAPCRIPAFPRHFPRRTHETQLAWDVLKLSILPPALQNTNARVGHPRSFAVTPDFIALAQLQSRLEYVIEQSTRSSLVVVDMSDSDMALRDLHSSLSSKDILVRDLRRFVEDARTTSESLQQFRQHVWEAVGQIVHGNNHAIGVLEDILLEGAEGSRDNNPYIPRFFGRGTALRQEMEDTWLRGTTLLEKILRKSIMKAHDNFISLKTLEKELVSVQNMVFAGEDSLRSKEQGLKRQWFPDERELGHHSASFKLLLIAQEHCERALIHMKGIRSRLEEIGRDLNGLGATTTPSSVPIEDYINILKKVTERLNHGQTSMIKTVDGYRRGKFDHQPISTNFIEH